MFYLRVACWVASAICPLFSFHVTVTVLVAINETETISITKHFL